MPSLSPSSQPTQVEALPAHEDKAWLKILGDTIYPPYCFGRTSDSWEQESEDHQPQLAERSDSSTTSVPSFNSPLLVFRLGAQRARALAATQAVGSHQVTARRLQELQDQTVASPGPSRSFFSETDPTIAGDCNPYLELSEIIAHDTLIDDGGRPVYDIHCRHQVFAGPQQHHPSLQPWIASSPDWHKNLKSHREHDLSLRLRNISSPDWQNVFQNQLSSWNKFRRWQRHNRAADEEEEFADYFKEQQRHETKDAVLRNSLNRYLGRLRISYDSKSRAHSLEYGAKGFAKYVELSKVHDLERGNMWPGITEDEYMLMLQHLFKRDRVCEGRDNVDERFAVFVREQKEGHKRSGRTWPGITTDECREVHRRIFNREQRGHCRREFLSLRVYHGRDGFPRYVKEVEERLARHGFNQDVKLDRDVTRQDQLTTWIEYLHYEYSWLDKGVQVLAKLQADHDREWQKLVDAKAVRSNEIAAKLHTLASARELQREIDGAKSDLDCAKLDGMQVLSASMQIPRSASRKQHLLQVRMGKARSKYRAAEERLTQLERGKDLIEQFVQADWRYNEIDEAVGLTRIRIRWAQEQTTQIRAEMEEGKMAVIDSSHDNTSQHQDGSDQCDREGVDRESDREGQSQAEVGSTVQEPHARAGVSKRGWDEEQDDEDTDVQRSKRQKHQTAAIPPMVDAVPREDKQTAAASQTARTRRPRRGRPPRGIELTPLHDKKTNTEPLMTPRKSRVSKARTLATGVKTEVENGKKASSRRRPREPAAQPKMPIPACRSTRLAGVQNTRYDLRPQRQP